MQDLNLSPVEQRVLGCLIEKRFTTPDQYPLSLNSLRLACNQATNRDPVTDYDETAVREAAQRLCREGLARLASGHTSRAIKYRHLAEEALGLERAELALLTVLLLRGAQTPGELKSRSERMERIETLEQVQLHLEALIQRGYARRLERRPGQKEERYEQLLGGSAGSAQVMAAGADLEHRQSVEHGVATPAGTALPHAPQPAPEPPIQPAAAARIETGQTDDREGASQLRQELSALADRVQALERMLADLREQLGESPV